MQLELYTKSKVQGIFVLNLQRRGYDRSTAEMLVKSKPEFIERVMKAQVDFIKMCDSSLLIREYFYTLNHLRRFLGRIIEKETENLLGLLGSK